MKNKTLLLAVLLGLWSGVAHAAYTTFTDGIFKFAINYGDASPTVTVSLSPDCDKSAITEIIIPTVTEYNGKTYTVIETASRAFEDLPNLKTVSMPPTIKEIGFCSFQNCPNLVSVEIGSSVEAIESYTFSNCLGLKSIFIPASVTHIDSSSFYHCFNLKNLQVSEANAVYSAENGILFNKDKTIGITYPSAQGAVVLPEGMQKFGYEFFDWKIITSLYIPASITDLPISQLKNYGIALEISPDNHTYAYTDGMLTNKAGTELLMWKTAPAELVIPDQITKIGYGVFQDYKYIKTVTFPSSIEEVELSAFCNCTGVTDVYSYANEPPKLGAYNFCTVNQYNGGEVFLPVNIYVEPECVEAYKNALHWKFFKIYPFGFLVNGTTFSDDNFSYRVISEYDYFVEIVSLKNTGILASNPVLTIPETVDYEGQTYTVTAIGKSAFSGISSLSGVNLPSSIQTIKEYAFLNCSNLYSIFLPASVESVNGTAFAYTPVAFTVSPDNPYLSSRDGMLLSKNGEEIISWQPQTTFVEIPDYIKIIGNSAIGENQIIQILVIPSSVEVIETEAFCFCKNLKSVYFHASTPPLLRREAFTTDCTYYVPPRSISLYKEEECLKSKTVKGFGLASIKSVIVSEKPSGEIMIDMADLSRILLQDAGLTFIASPELYLPFSDINKVSFSAADSGIEEGAQSPSSGLSFSCSGDLLSISGLGENEVIQIFSMAGICVLRSNASGSALVDISSLPSGIYILKAGSGSAKFIKK